MEALYSAQSSPSRPMRSNTSPGRTIFDNTTVEIQSVIWRSDRRLETDITFRNVSPELRNGEISPIAAASGSRHLSPLRAIRGRNSFRIEAENTEHGSRNAGLPVSGLLLGQVVS
jgi:hypothetical protein